MTRPPHITTLVYALAGTSVAMLKRDKAPNLGLWSPPGGKVEPGETPLASALRELREETGLTLREPRLRAVVTEQDPDRDEAWLMFVFAGRAEDPAALRSSVEGEACWVPLQDLADLPAPPADRHILDAVAADRPGVAFLEVAFSDGRLGRVETSWA